jgi:hypothetical protein
MKKRKRNQRPGKKAVEMAKAIYEVTEQLSRTAILITITVLHFFN